MENIDVRITQYPRKTVVSDFDIFLIADVSDVDVVTGFPKYKKVLAKDLPSIVNTAENITYAELLAQSVLGELVVGEFYNITDSTSGIAPILVQAISDSSIGYLAFDGDNPLLTINYDFITDTVRWSKDQTSQPVALDSFSAVTPLSYDDTTGVFTISQSSATTNGYLSATDWATFSAKQNALSGTGLVKSTSGTISYITDSSSNWDSAYNDTITSAAVTGTTSKLLTLTQRDGGTITASWGDLNSVTSVFGRTGAVIAESGDYTTTQVTEGTNLYYTQDRFNTAFANKTTSDLAEGTNLYYTDTRARASFSETVTGLTYTPLTGVLSTTAGYGIPTTASQTNWDTAYANRITSATTPLVISANTISIPKATSSLNGYLSSTDWTTFNSKQDAGNYITALTGEATASGPNSASVTLSNSAVIGKVLTGLNITGGSISASDSILNAFGKVQNQINGLIGGSIYQGVWNASTNYPALASGVGTQGYYYIVSVAGSTNLDGITDWNIGDWAIFDGTAWQQVDNTDAVVSVNGQVGIVNLTTTNISEGTNLYYTDVRVSANSDVSANTAARHNAVTLGTANGLSLATQQLSLGLSSASATGALSSTDWSTFSGKQNALSGTGIVKSVSGTISYLTDNSANWDSAYNNSIVSAGVTGTTTKTLTLNQQDGGTITASWTDDNTDAVISVFGRTGAVIAVSGDYTTTQVTEGTNLYYTEGRVDANSNVAANTAARHNAVTIGTANGLSLSTQQISLGLSSGTTTGALSSTDWTTFNSKQNALGFTPEPAITAGTTAQYWRGDKSFQTLDTSVVPENTNLYYTSARFDTAFGTKTTTNLTEGTNLYFTDSRARAAITLTTTGTSGVATYVGGTLNIPDYGSALGAYLPLAGGTLTGALYGTTATFSGVVSAKGSAPYYQWLNASDTRLAYIQHNGSDLVISTDTGDIVLAPTGKVGIKNDAPSQNLTVGDGTGTGNQYVRIFASASDIYIGQSGGTLFGQSANSAGYVLSDNISFPFVVGTIAAQDLIFGTNNTARITINGSTGALTATSSITASSFVKSGGTSSQALLADGSVGTFSASNWNTAYNDSIVSAAVTGTSTKTLTLNQQDGGTITASWSESSAPVVSVFGRTGAILAAEGDYSLTQLSDVTLSSPTNGQVLKYNGTAWVNGTDTDTGLTSVGLSMPSAFTVSNSPLTANGTLAVTGAGTTAQYVRGDGSLATFPSVASEAKTLITEVYNNTGATLTKGTVVYINGGQGNLPTVTKALANSDSTSAQTYGVVQTDITNMNNGFVVVIGSLMDLDTFAYTNGTILYLSPTTAGEWTSTKPYAPQHIVYIGIVVRQHPTQGVVEVRVQNGYEMDELHNVSAQSPANGDILQFNYSTQLWTKTAGITTNIAEGTNLYYTAARFNSAFSGKTTTDLTEGTNLYYTAARFNTAFSGKSTTDLAEGTNLYFTDARARAAISLTTTGSSGVATYSGGVLNIPNYGAALSGYLPLSGGTLTGNLNGTSATFSGVITLPQNPVGTTYGNGISTSPLYMITQGAGDNDAIRFYAESAATNQVTMVFEVNDDIETAGSEWIFRNKKTYGDYAATTPFRISGGGAAYINGDTVLHAGNYNSYAPTLTGTGASGTWGISITGNAATLGSYAETSFVRLAPNSSSPTNGNFAMGQASSRNFIQSHSGQPLDLNPLGNAVTINGYTPITSSNIGSQSVNYATTAGALTSMLVSQFTNDSGYITSSALSGYLPLTGGTLTGNLTGTTSLFSNSAATTSHGTSGKWIASQTANGNFIPYSFEAEYGNHSWGIVARFRINQANADRPSIQFSNATNDTRWNIGYCAADDLFRITQNMGYRNDNTTSDSWGTERFKIDTSGNTYAAIGGTLYANGNIVLDAANYTSYAATVGHTHDLGRYSLQAPAYIDGLTGANFRSTLFGHTNNNFNISTARWNTTPAILSGLGAYGTMIAWSGADTQGFIAMDYASGNAKIGGGNGNNINWTAILLHSSNISSYAWTASGSWKPASLSSSTRLIGITSPDGGEFALAYSGGQIFPYTDGFFYQNEGAYRVIDTNSIGSYAPTLTGGGASGSWGISVTGNAATATNISNTGTVTLATATESNSIYITQPSYTTDTPVKLLNFDWYGEVWSMGNIRSGGATTAGFGIYLSGSEKFRFNRDGEAIFQNRVTTTAWSTSGRNYSNEWIEFPNYSGLYSPNNAAHFLPNNGSYGAWKINGNRNGWNGLEFGITSSNICLMVYPGGNQTGFYNTAYGWQFLWNNGELQVSKADFGGGTLYTVLDAANYSSYALPKSGGTLTGGLIGTTATFSGRIITGTGDILGGSASSDTGTLTLRGGYGLTTASASKIEIRGFESGGATQGALMFYTNNTERFRISQTGAAVFFGSVGVTSSYLSVGAYGLASDTYSAYFRRNDTSTYSAWSIDGAKGGYVGALYNTPNLPHMMFSSTDGNGGLYYQTASRWITYYHYANNCLSIGGATSSASYRFYVNGDSRIVGTFNVSTLTTNGVVYSNGGNLTNTNPSDARLKEDIKPLEYGLNEIMALNPVKFKWKDGSNNGEEQIGLIAQNVQEVMPDLVKNISEDSDLLGLDSYAINIVLINAIKELKAEIELLKNK